MGVGSSRIIQEYENDVNHMLWPSQPPDLNPIEHLSGILDRHVRKRSPPRLSKHQIREYLLEEWYSFPPVEFQRLIELMPRRTEVVLAAHGSQTPY